jgi:transcriptional/translational regulatory protein YebC/TACO1
MNSRLADLIGKAKKEGFAKSSIEAAISRGQGRSTSGASLETVTIEGILPNNVAVICDCETDSRLRTLMEAKLVLKNAGGRSTPAAYLFEKRGRVAFEKKDGVGVDEALEIALEAGAIDVEEDEERNIIVFCNPTEVKAMGEAMSTGLGLVITNSEIIWSPNEDTKVALPSETAAEELSAFVDDLLEKETTVQAISMNVAQGNISDFAWKDLESRLST